MKRALDFFVLLMLFRQVLMRAYRGRIVVALGSVALLWLLGIHQAQADQPHRDMSVPAAMTGAMPAPAVTGR